MILDKLLEWPKKKILMIITLIAFVAFIILTLSFSPTETELKTATGYGIMEFELAWTAEMIQTIFAAWGQAGMQKQVLVNVLDYLYMPAYAFFIGGMILIVARNAEGKLQKISLIMVLTPFVAAGFDVVENINLLLMLFDPAYITMGSPFAASLCASIKFTFLLAGIFYFFIALILLLISRRK